METGILRNIHTDDAYRHVKENLYRNIRTGKEGIVEEGKANTVFRINVEATMICNQYPIVEYLINKLDLKLEKNGNTSLPQL